MLGVLEIHHAPQSKLHAIADFISEAKGRLIQCHPADVWAQDMRGTPYIKYYAGEAKEAALKELENALHGLGCKRASVAFDSRTSQLRIFIEVDL